MTDYKKDYALGRAKWIEAQISKYELETGINLDAHNKATLRDMKGKEFDFYERQMAREEEGHSHSAVGDEFNMGNNNE